MKHKIEMITIDEIQVGQRLYNLGVVTKVKKLKECVEVTFFAPVGVPTNTDDYRTFKFLPHKSIFLDTTLLD